MTATHSIQIHTFQIQVVASYRQRQQQQPGCAPMPSLVHRAMRPPDRPIIRAVSESDEDSTSLRFSFFIMSALATCVGRGPDLECILVAGAAISRARRRRKGLNQAVQRAMPHVHTFGSHDVYTGSLISPLQRSHMQSAVTGTFVTLLSNSISFPPSGIMIGRRKARRHWTVFCSSPAVEDSNAERVCRQEVIIRQ